jgi:hypothetical protein
MRYPLWTNIVSLFYLLRTVFIPILFPDTINFTFRFPRVQMGGGIQSTQFMLSNWLSFPIRYEDIAVSIS